MSSYREPPRQPEEKLWGTTLTVLEHPFNTAHRIEVDPRGYCSWHFHERKWNVFVGVEGILTIVIHDNEGRNWSQELTPGDVVAVPPMWRHRFINMTHNRRAVAVEYYFPDKLGEDIVRFDTGGANWKD